jgi:uncharacterized membrane protein
VSELRDLLIAISVLVPALASAFVLVWNTVRSGGRKPEQVARSAAEEAAATVLEAVADGELSEEDLDAIDRALRRTKKDGGSK